MGPLRADVQGSVHKGKRTSDMVTAIKLLPVTIKPHSADFKKFQTAAESLRDLNLEPNANLARVLNYGVSEIGSHPFIEAEFIEGPDLGELLEPPHEKIFTLLEVVKVADHLANAIAQTHRHNLLHGSIKLSNVKFNIKTADYVLVGFGLSALTSQQRSGLKPPEDSCIAPEQAEGQLLQQSDIYSYGVILYELLTGVQPFLVPPALPLLIETRQENLPAGWSHEQREREMQIPEWLLEIIIRCLQPVPEERFANGNELQEALVRHSLSAFEYRDDSAGTGVVLQNEVERLRSLVIQTQENSSVKEVEMARLKAILNHKEEQLSGLKYQMGNIVPERSGVTISKPALFSLIVIIVCLGSLAAYFLFEEKDRQNSLTAYTDSPPDPDSSTANAMLQASTDSNLFDAGNVMGNNPGKNESRDPAPAESEKRVIEEGKRAVEEEKPVLSKSATATKKDPRPSRPRQNNERQEEREPAYEHPPARIKYTLGSSQANFYGRPDEESRLNLVLVPSDNSELVALEDSNGFIYVSFFDTQGKMVRGWLRKQDLRRLN